MDSSFNQKLIKLLKKDSRFVDEDGELVKSAVIDKAWKINKGLVKLLLSHKQIKDKFFDEIEKHWIFNINTFIDFISDKNFLDNSYTRFRNRIGLTIDGKYLKERGEVCLVWPYKDCVLEGGQTKEEEKRKEIFFNEVLAQDEIDRLLDPKTLTNFKRFTPEGEKKVTELKRDENGTIRENLIIKGNNFLALHCLKKQFAGKIKLIYIDPPYNIGGDSFGYNDNFNHSAWITFMKNRLEIAKELLRDDGVIFVQIDDNELAHLKVLMDEIFSKTSNGKSNFVQYVEIKANVGAAQEYQNPFMPKNCEYGLIYAKNYEKRKYKPIWIKSEVDNAYKKIILNPDEKDFTKWRIGKVLDEFIKEYGEENKNNKELLYKFVFKNINRIFRTISPKGAGSGLVEAMKRSKKETWAVYERDNKENIICYKGEMVRFYSKNTKEDIDGNKIIGIELGSLWDDIAWQGIAPEGGVTLKSGKKPEKLLKRIIYMATEPGEIVLDFFMGTGTTCAVAHKTGRQYIGIEQLEYGENDSVQRLKNVIGRKKKGSFVDEYGDYDTSGISKAVNWQGGGDFVYFELMKYNEVYMDKIQEAKTSKELVKLWKEIAENSFLNWYVSPEMPEDAIKDFEDIGKDENGIEKQKRLLCELLNKNQLYVNLSEIYDKQFNVSKEDKGLNEAFYGEDY